MKKPSGLLILLILLCIGGCNQGIPLEVSPTITPENTITTTLTSQMPPSECTTINLLYNERHPYLETITSGSVQGLTATPATLAFEQANIPFRWKLTPSTRQLKTLEGNLDCACAVGWFKNSEREAFAHYTLPIYQDRSQIAIARADNPALQDGIKVTDLLANHNLLLGVKDGYSYGPFLDEMIARYNPPQDPTTLENINMLLKVHERRNDYFFLAPEEADGLLEDSGLPREDFQYINFVGMPPGEKRYILCSYRVSETIIEQLNVAIEENVHLE